MADIDMKIVPVVHPPRPASHTVAPESSALSDLLETNYPIIVAIYRVVFFTGLPFFDGIYYVI